MLYCGYFQQSCTNQYLADVTRKDLLNFAVFCRDELELSTRTAFNKFARVVAFLKTHTIKLHDKRDTPKLVNEEPKVYEKEDSENSSQRVMGKNVCGLRCS